MADLPNYLRRRAEWLDRLSRDPEISAVAFRVAFIVGSHMNRESGLAWPAVPTIAAEACISLSAAKRALAALIEGGHLVVETDRGRGRSNRYRVPTAKENSSPADCFPTPENGSAVIGKRFIREQKTVHQRPPNAEENTGSPLVTPVEPRNRHFARTPEGAALGDLTRPATDHREIEDALAAGELTPAEADFLRRNRSAAHV